MLEVTVTSRSSYWKGEIGGADEIINRENVAGI